MSIPKRLDYVAELIRVVETWTPTVSNGDREKRRRYLAQAHEALCADKPEGGLSDYRSLLPYVPRLVHIANLKIVPYLVELCDTIISRGCSCAAPRGRRVSSAPDPMQTLDERTTSESFVNTELGEQLGKELWQAAITPLDEKKVPKDESLCVQAVAVHALNSLISASRSTGVLAVSHGNASQWSSGLVQLLQMGSAVQRFEKRGFGTTKSTVEEKQEAMAYLRRFSVLALASLRKLYPDIVSLSQIASCVGESGYKARDFLLCRTALTVLGDSDDLEAIMAAKSKLPDHYDPNDLSRAQEKQILKAQWQHGPVGAIQIWEPGTAIATGRLCIKAMTLCDSKKKECAPEFTKGLGILLHHPSTGVFLSLSAVIVDNLNPTSLKLLGTSDPVYSGNTTILDHLFDRLLGSCTTNSETQLLATLATVERFAEKAFHRLTSDTISISWFAALPATLHSIWEKHSDSPGIVLAALRVWGALMLLERCMASVESKKGSERAEEAVLEAEAAADAFFHFLLQPNVVRTLHIETSTALFDVLEHFARQLATAAADRLTPSEVSQFIRRLCCVLIEAPFVAHMQESSSASSEVIITRTSQVFRTLLDEPRFSKQPAHVRLIRAAAAEVQHMANSRGSFDLSQALDATLVV